MSPDFSGDLIGRCIPTTRDQQGNTTDYNYDPTAGNLESIVHVDASQQQFTYDAAGNVTRSVSRRGIAIDYTYDSDGMLTRKDYRRRKDRRPGRSAIGHRPGYRDRKPGQRSAQG